MNKEHAKEWMKSDPESFNKNIRYVYADYLRSQSYLIGFRNYSIEQILEMGWAKIK